MKFQAQTRLRLPAFLVLILLVGLQMGCDRETTPVSPPFDESPDFTEGAMKAPPGPPPTLADITFDGQELTLWPYTGASLDGNPSDPVNLVFVGEASPLQIRAALLSLDGNRPGTLPMPPFDSTWSDAIGGVQACYTPDDGWMGGVVQLQLGD